MTKAGRLTTARLGATAAILVAGAALIPRGTLTEVWVQLAAVPWYGVVGLMVLQCFSLALLGYQWVRLLREISVGPVRWPAVMQRYLGGSFVEAVTPAAKLGGEAARVLLFRQRFGVSAPAAAGAAVTHAAAMIAGLALLMPVMLLLVGNELVYGVTGFERGMPAIGVAAGLGSLAVFRVVLPRVKSRLGIARYSRRTIGVLVAVAMAVWVLYPLKVAAVARLLGVGVPLGVIVAATFVAYFAGLLPLTPGGLGSYEGAMIAVFAAAGVPPAEAAGITLLARFFSFWWPLALSAVAAAGMGAGSKAIRSQGGAMYERSENTTAPGSAGRWGERLLVRSVQTLERLAARYPRWAGLYTRLFYRRMIELEYGLAELQPGDRVLQLGAGPFPMTALALAERGCHVTAVDCDPEALRAAEGVLRAHGPGGLAGSVALREDNGLNLSAEGYAAVILALHITPKAEILCGILETADAETRVLYRNPRGFLRGAYKRVTPGELGLSQPGKIIALPGNKELVMVRKPAGLTSDAQIASMKCAECALCDLAPKQLGTIAYAPDLPALAALGVRPGKTCSLVAAQPWGGPVICSVGGRQVALERSIAASIGVTRPGSEEPGAVGPDGEE